MYLLSPFFCSRSASVIKAVVTWDRLTICSYFTIFRYLIVWFLVLRKLMISSHPAEAEAYTYRACFESVWDIGNLFKGLQQVEHLPALCWALPIFLSVLWIVPSTCSSS